MLPDDPLANVLYVDLTKKRFRSVRREDLFQKYLGGAGVAAQLLLEECPENCDPLGPDNPIILAVGPLTALFPLASKTVAFFKVSPYRQSGREPLRREKRHSYPLRRLRGDSHQGSKRYTAIPGYSRQYCHLSRCRFPLGHGEQFHRGADHPG